MVKKIIVVLLFFTAFSAVKGQKITVDEAVQIALKNNFDIHIEVTKALCNRLVYKSTMLSELAIEEAEHRIITLINYLLENTEHTAKKTIKLTFTRQQIADMTGLRVETVIRSIKSLEQKRCLEIDSDGKIIWKYSSKT